MTTREQRGLALDAQVLLAAERAAGGDLGDEDLARVAAPGTRRPGGGPPRRPGRASRRGPGGGDGRAVRPDRAPRDGEGGLGLQERVLDGGGPEAGARHVRGARERRVHVPAPHDGAGDDVAALVDLRRVVGEGGEGIGDGGERLQLHLDQGGGGGGGLARLRGDRGQHVAHVPDDLALGDQQRPVRADEALLAAAGDIRGGQHGDHARDRARRRRVDGAHERARHAGEAQRPVEHARRDEIAHERLLAQGELAALVARTGHGLHAGRLAAADGGGQRDRVDDRRVAGAAAEVAGQGAGDGLAGRAPGPGAGGPRPSSRCPASSSRTARPRWPRTHPPTGRGHRRARPSSVSTDRPATRSAGRAQDTTACPSTMTVHAPHEPSGAQPSFIDRRPHSLAQDVEQRPAGRGLDDDRPAVEREVHRTPSRPVTAGPSGPSLADTDAEM